MGARRFLVVSGLAIGAAVAVAACRSRFGAMRRSLRTSSSAGAGAYEMAAGLFLGGCYDDMAADCAVALAGVAGPSILEVGPGPGHLAERLLELVPDARWTGLDVDPAMLEAARRRLAIAGHEAAATMVEGDVAAMPFPDAAFDLVVSSLSAHHWTDAAAGFREIRRVLRPGATALVFDLPETWGHAETGSAGLAAAADVFESPDRSRLRGIGPWTILWRLELRA